MDLQKEYQYGSAFAAIHGADIKPLVSAFRRTMAFMKTLKDDVKLISIQYLDPVNLIDSQLIDPLLEYSFIKQIRSFTKFDFDMMSNSETVTFFATLVASQTVKQLTSGLLRLYYYFLCSTFCLIFKTEAPISKSICRYSLLRGPKNPSHQILPTMFK